MVTALLSIREIDMKKDSFKGLTYDYMENYIKNHDDDKKTIINKGVNKICQKRYWTQRDLKNYGYLKAKVREYDKAKIEQENKERYERIKEEKYASGEWVRPKKEN